VTSYLSGSLQKPGEKAPEVRIRIDDIALRNKMQERPCGRIIGFAMLIMPGLARLYMSLLDRQGMAESLFSPLT